MNFAQLKRLVLSRLFLCFLAGILNPVPAATSAAPTADDPAGVSVGTDPQAPHLRYTVRLERPTTHLIAVEIRARRADEPHLDFVMPAWSPGRYAIYDFAKNVQDFAATDAEGRLLPWIKLDKQTWRVDSAVAGDEVRVSYRVFANDLSGTFSQLDSSHALLNGASVFMFIAGRLEEPVELALDPPPGWKVYSGLSLSPEERVFRLASYHLLADASFEISPEVQAEQFQEGGKTFRVAIHRYGEDPGETPRLLEGLRQLARAQLAAMPDPGFGQYTFIFHFAPHVEMGDGMEHHNATQVILKGDPAGEALEEALVTASHELYHVWNIKRLRPAPLIPYEYTREQYSRSLWFAEGATTYLSYLFMLRAGLWTRQQFFERLVNEIRVLDYEPGRLVMSAEDSSFHAWFYDRSPQMQQTNFANTTINYYNKGAVISLLLDLEIRARTQGTKSLNDVVIRMYEKFYEAAPAGSPEPRRGYKDADILTAVNEVAGADFGDFFARFVSGTEPLDYAASLARAGLALQIRTSSEAAPTLGILGHQMNGGFRVTAVRTGSAGDLAGLSRGDLIVDVDGVSIEFSELRNHLRIYPPGAEVLIGIVRHGRTHRLPVKLDPPLPDEYEIRELPQADTAQRHIRRTWLGKP